MKRTAIIYRTGAGEEPYSKYMGSLRDREGAAKIRVRVNRAELGNLGDHRSVGHGVIELRIDFRPGYRLFAALHGQEFIILLCAGDKSSQQKDIHKAYAYWEDFRRNP